MSFSVRVKTTGGKQWRQLLGDLESKIIPQVETSTLTGTARVVRTASVDDLKAALGIPASEVRKRIREKRAKPGEPHAAVYLNKRRIILRDGGTGKTNPYRQARIPNRGSRGKVRYGRHVFPNAFAIKKGGTRIVLERVGNTVRAAGVDVMPKGGEILKTNTERLGKVTFERLYVERLQKALRSRGRGRLAGVVGGF